MIYVLQFCWHIPLLCVQWKTPDDGQRNSPKHVEFHSKNKFQKLVHLVGFIVRKFNSVCWYVWMWKLASYIKGKTRMGVFENRVVGNTFGPKREEVKGEWRRLYNEELHDCYVTSSCWVLLITKVLYQQSTNVQV
jgi:hypothetical protein